MNRFLKSLISKLLYICSIAVLLSACKAKSIASQTFDDKPFACSEYKTSSEYIRSVSFGYNSDATKAQKLAIGSAKEVLAQQIAVTLRKAKEVLKSMDPASLDQKERILIHQIIKNIKPTCDQLVFDKPKGIYTYKVAYELWGQDVTTNYLDGLSTENEDIFKSKFEKAMNKLAKEQL